MKRVHLFISGRVQMVCFRGETEVRAKLLGLKGFVRNLRDKRVEIVLEGEDSKVEKLTEWTKRGPALAKVTNIEIIDEEYRKEFKNFKILY